jgi:hypothetical protein
MVRGGAAQLGVAEVEWLDRARPRGRDQGRRRGLGVGDHPDGVAHVEAPGLCRDVGGRVVQPQVRREALGPVLRHDLAVPVGVEAVEHDPVEPGQQPHLLHDRVPERLHVRGRGEPPHRATEPGEELGLRPDGRLHLDEEEPLALVRDEVRATAGQLRGDRGDRAAGEGLGGGRAHRLGRRAAQHRVQRAAEHLVDRLPQQAGRVRAGLDDLAARPVDGEQHPVRLHRPGRVQRLARALDEPGLLVGWQQVLRASHRPVPPVVATRRRTWSSPCPGCRGPCFPVSRTPTAAPRRPRRSGTLAAAGWLDVQSAAARTPDTRSRASSCSRARWSGPRKLSA